MLAGSSRTVPRAAAATTVSINNLSPALLLLGSVATRASASLPSASASLGACAARNLVTEAADKTKSSRLESELDVERIDSDIFRSRKLWRPTFSRGVYGGQVLAQALQAADRTVSDASANTTDKYIHSMHSYFMLPGNADMPIVYKVERVRDGNSFANRKVDAVQNGRPIFSSITSFHRSEESEIEHQYPIPDVPGPDDVPSMEDLLDQVLADETVSKAGKHLARFALEKPFPIELRPTTPLNMFGGRPLDPYSCMWMRTMHDLPAHQNYHRCVLAFLSDFGLATTALRPHDLSATSPRLQMLASLDHSMWFHEEFDATDWLLFETESPRAHGNRLLSFGRFYDQKGRLVASVAQEAVARAEKTGETRPVNVKRNGGLNEAAAEEDRRVAEARAANRQSK